MKTRLTLAILFQFFLMPCMLLAAGKRDAMWKNVTDAESKGLPKTAIEKLGPIIEQAMAEKAYPEAIKAVARKIAFEGQIEGQKAEEKITRLEAEIAKAPKETVPVMDAILADRGRTSRHGICRGFSPRLTSSSRRRSRRRRS